MADAVEPVGEHMHEEAADELEGRQAHGLHTIPALDPVILPFERHSVGISADQAMVGDGDAVGVAGQVGQHLFGSAKWWFGVDDPIDLAQGSQPFAEGAGICQFGEVTEEPQLSCAMQGLQAFDEQPSEQPRQHAHMQKEARLTSDPLGAVWGQTAARDNHVDVRVMGECRAPGVQNAGHASVGTKAFGIGSDGRHRLSRRFEQQSIDRPLVPKGDPRDLRWQREDHVEILDRQQVLCAGRHPVARRRCLTLRAMPVLAAVVGNVLMVALGTGGHMPAECLRSAGFNR